jgi:hypothetical protein
MSCTHLMCCLLCVPGEAMMSMMSGALVTQEQASEAESHGACGDVRALPHQEEVLELQGMWRHRSPSLWGGRPGGTGHMATPEPSHTGRRVWSHGTRDNTRALPYWAAGSVARGDARALPHRKADLESWDMW